ncbi:MAG TPA: hypothetical protein V6C72_01915 [Chroococcales cyanobacterium]
MSRILVALVCLLMLGQGCAHALATQAIGWIPTWSQAVAEARRTNKPILLVAAAPSCGNVPGVW